MSGDYIKLNRKMLKWEWYGNINTKVLFLHCLLKANWKDAKFEGRVIKRGSFVTSIPKLSLETELTVREVRTAIDHLKATGELTVKTTNKYSVITVNNYNLYQDSDTQIDSQMTGERQSNDSPLTGNRHSIDSLTTTIEEYKEIEKGEERKEDKKEISDSDESDPPPKPRRKPKDPKHQYGEYGHVLLTDKERDRLFNDYGEAQALEAIRYLDEYIQMKGYKAKDHNLAIRKWVFDALDRERQKQQRRDNSNGYRDNNGSIDWSKV